MPALSKSSSDVGLVGLAVMGQNLALNMVDHGHGVAVFNRTVATTERFVEAHRAHQQPGAGALQGARTLEEFVQGIKRPRRIVILVKAGAATDTVIEGLVPLLERGDLIVDGGNALWTDTIRRERTLRERGLLFIGSGVSGGEEGARLGPSLMAGGTPAAWALLEPVWTSIAAKVDEATGKPLTGAAPGRPRKGGAACAALVGPDGAGHYVKMVHNGIEYADMQLICEAYDMLRRVVRLEPHAAGEVFASWNLTELDSFLIEITADILKQKDPVTGRPFVDVVLDAAGQKGTGKWTSSSALDLGIPAPTIAEAVFARGLSAMKEERVAVSKSISMPASTAASLIELRVEDVRDALFAAKICAYAQGFQLMSAAAKEHRWQLDFATLARIWRGGCIIRARLLHDISQAYETDAALPNLVLAPHIAAMIESAQPGWRKVVARAALQGVPAPALGSALAYFDGARSEHLPANLLQAQRDYFGSHLYERVDAPRGKRFHLEWLMPGRPQRAENEG
jgi:6-phosphogluconate dehydrogenase